MTVTHTISKTRAKVGETVTVSTSGIEAGVMNNEYNNSKSRF